MKILDRIKLMFVKGGSPDEKRPDDMTSKKMSGAMCAIGDKCCQAPSAESKSCCGEDSDCDCK